MKTLLLTCLIGAALLGSAVAQTPPPPPTASPVESVTPTVTPLATLTPAASAIASAAASAKPDADDDDLGQSIRSKVHKHLNFTVGGHGAHTIETPMEGSEWMAVPIVMIVFLAIFGAPVAVVGLIMYFSMSKTRALHRTVRMMVEKGQEVPAALLNPPPAQRQRSDMRRGIVLLMIGLGIMLFLGAVNSWEGGAWALGIIPFLIGVGYLLVWKLEGQRKDNPPPLP